jgi:putative ABC transport system permease protein
VTGILYVKLKIKPLLCGILVSTGLISINLVAVTAGLYGDFAGESSAMIPFGRDLETLTTVFPVKMMPNKIGIVSGLRDLLLFLVMAIAFKLLLDAFLKTKCGLLLRAAGDNAQFVTTQAKDAGESKILGLGIGNAYAAVAGALYTEISGNVNQSMGIGMVVIGLASLIIGLSVFSRVHFLKPTTKVIFGAIIYQACLTIAQRLGMPSAYNKLIMAIIFTIALIFSERKKTKAKILKQSEGKESSHHA